MIHRVTLCGIVVGLFCLGAPGVQCQSQVIQEILNAVNLDSLRLTVQVLSGELGSQNGGTTDTIRSRVYSSSTHDLAAEFLKAKLESYGLSSEIQAYTDSFSNEHGLNVFAEQRGSSGESCKYILCAHYDSITDSSTLVSAPGADDNASGCAAVLEAARLLSQYKILHTLVYALWDREEVGASGSDYYARSARSRGDSIIGVVNLEMLGWDSNNDGLMDIHTSSKGISRQMADTVGFVSSLYQLSLNPVIYDPGTSGSDHAAFWRKGYSAINFGEAFWGGDFNPHYHSVSDRLQYFNMPYFHNLAKLAAGSIALLAGIQGPAGCVIGSRAYSLTPFVASRTTPTPSTQRRRSATACPNRSHVTLTVFNTLGQQVAQLVNGEMEAGFHEVRFDGAGLSSGVYFYRMQAGTYAVTKTLLLVR